MTEQTSEIDTLTGLRDFIHSTLCEKENLVREQFLMSELPLVLYGAPCGLQFTIRGPRSIRLSAVWASDPNMVYFYDARGERFLKVQLKNRFELPSLAPASSPRCGTETPPCRPPGQSPRTASGGPTRPTKNAPGVPSGGVFHSASSYFARSACGTYFPSF